MAENQHRRTDSMTQNRARSDLPSIRETGKLHRDRTKLETTLPHNRCFVREAGTQAYMVIAHDHHIHEIT